MELFEGKYGGRGEKEESVGGVHERTHSLRGLWYNCWMKKEKENEKGKYKKNEEEEEEKEKDDVALARMIASCFQRAVFQFLLLRSRHEIGIIITAYEGDRQVIHGLLLRTKSLLSLVGLLVVLLFSSALQFFFFDCFVIQ